MKTYKIFRWLLKASALTTVMFVMKACYGRVSVAPELLDDTELVVEDEVKQPVSDTLDTQNSL